MVRWFSIADVNKGAARFDTDKLTAVNAEWMRRTPDDELVERVESTLPHIMPPMAIHNGMTDENRERLRRAMPGLKERARTLVDLADAATYIFVRRPIEPDEKAAAILAGDGIAHVRELLPRLEAVDEWSAESTEAVVRAYAEETGHKLGKVAQPLRAALTGRTTSPGIFDVLDVLGREEVLARLRDTV